MASNEQVKKDSIMNLATVTGTLMELTSECKKNKNGGDYIKATAVVKYGETDVECVSVDFFVNALNKEGKETAAYKELVEFCKKAKTVKVHGAEADRVVINCPFSPSDYVNKEEKLVEINKWTARKIVPAKASDENGFNFTCKAYIQSITDEVKNDEPTGRLRVQLVTATFANEAVVIKNVVVPEHLVRPMQSQCSEGQTALFGLKYLPHIAEVTVKDSDGFGEVKTTSGKSYLELSIVGAREIKDEDDEGALSKSLITEMLKVRKEKLKELESKGYQGNASGGNVATKSTVASVSALAEDDIPF